MPSKLWIWWGRRRVYQLLWIVCKASCWKFLYIWWRNLNGVCLKSQASYRFQIKWSCPYVTTWGKLAFLFYKNESKYYLLCIKREHYKALALPRNEQNGRLPRVWTTWCSTLPDVVSHVLHLQQCLFPHFSLWVVECSWEYGVLFSVRFTSNELLHELLQMIRVCDIGSDDRVSGLQSYGCYMDAMAAIGPKWS